MMFRSTHGEEESGSDWDDYSPQATPLHRPAEKEEEEQRGYVPSFITPHHKKVLPPIRSHHKEMDPPPQDQDEGASVYRVATDESTQTEVAQSTTSMTGTTPGFHFLAVGEDSARWLVRDHKEAPNSLMGPVAYRSEQCYKRCATEVFATARIASDCLIVFLLECLYYFLYHVLFKLFCGALVTLAEAVCKPCLPACFNVALWPVCAFLLQVGRAVQLCLTPCMEVMGSLVLQCATLFKACRLVSVSTTRTVQHV